MNVRTRLSQIEEAARDPSAAVAPTFDIMLLTDAELDRLGELAAAGAEMSAEHAAEYEAICRRCLRSGGRRR